MKIDVLKEMSKEENSDQKYHKTIICLKGDNSTIEERDRDKTVQIMEDSSQIDLTLSNKRSQGLPK